MSVPLVSVVVPAYNHAGYLAQAIDSVLAQDHPAVELIVIDDGSTDHTPEVLAGYAARATVMRQENRGQAATLNRGWSMARGELLGYLSADDVLDRRAVSAAVAALARHPEAVLAYPDFRLVDPRTATVRTVRAPEFSYTRMLIDLECPPGPGALFRRSAFEAAGGWNPEFRQMPDFDYWLRLGLFGTFVRIPEALAGFRVHPDSQTYAPVAAARAEEPVRIIEAIFASGRLPPALVAQRERAVGNACIASAQLHLRAGRAGAAWACVRRAARLHPRTLLSARSARALVNALFNRVGHRALWALRHGWRAPAGTGSRSPRG